MIKHLSSKLDYLNMEEFSCALAEFLKFIEISLYWGDKETLFLPCGPTIDDIWHQYILETKDYFDLCEALKPNSYLHHSGLSFNQYRKIASKDSMKIWEEDFSVLSSYYRNFGDFDADKIQHWPVATHLMKTFGISIERLNQILSDMVKENINDKP